MESNFNLVLALVLMASLAACDAEVRETAGGRVQIEDSAGVRVVEYPGTSNTEAAFQFPPEPLYRHGTNSGGAGGHLQAHVLRRRRGVRQRGGPLRGRADRTSDRQDGRRTS